MRTGSAALPLLPEMIPCILSTCLIRSSTMSSRIPGVGAGVGFSDVTLDMIVSAPDCSTLTLTSLHCPVLELLYLIVLNTSFCCVGGVEPRVTAPASLSLTWLKNSLMPLVAAVNVGTLSLGGVIAFPRLSTAGLLLGATGPGSVVEAPKFGTVPVDPPLTVDERTGFEFPGVNEYGEDSCSLECCE